MGVGRVVAALTHIIASPIFIGKLRMEMSHIITGDTMVAYHTLLAQKM
jgi:hypothetical protein